VLSIVEHQRYPVIGRHLPDCVSYNGDLLLADHGLDWFGIHRSGTFHTVDGRRMTEQVPLLSSAHASDRILGNRAEPTAKLVQVLELSQITPGADKGLLGQFLTLV